MRCPDFKGREVHNHAVCDGKCVLFMKVALVQGVLIREVYMLYSSEHVTLCTRYFLCVCMCLNVELLLHKQIRPYVLKSLQCKNWVIPKRSQFLFQWMYCHMYHDGQAAS